MTDFLLELRSEEIPARMQGTARDELQILFRREMADAGVDPGFGITVWSTPRRLALIARDLPLATAAVSEEIKGPRIGAPPQALEGFLRKTGLTQDQLVEREGVWFAVIDKPGRAMLDLLAEAVPEIIRAFSWPKSMRWGPASTVSESLRWVRPLSGIVALLDDAVVPFAVENIAAGRVTQGHRFHHFGDLSITNAGSYSEMLRGAHVIVDHQERQGIIRDGAAKAFNDMGLEIIADEGLVIENAGLTEWPVPLVGGFDEAFLAVPPEVIQLTARLNQKYFMARTADETLAPVFACTANIDAVDGGAQIVAGNEKVLSARLSDAQFFWEQDQKKRLVQHAEKLANITFHEKLGTVADKVERVAKLARWLCEEGIVKGDPDLAEQAARLCKADLVTEMVGEFPELQGLMGGYYAAAEGLDPQVAAAIRDHYKPVGQGDDVPTEPVTVAVSLADKLDTISSFFHTFVQLQPTGSKDPFALRRAALAVIGLIQENGIRLPVNRVLEWIEPQVFEAINLADLRRKKAANAGGDVVQGFGALGDSAVEKLKATVTAFLADRLKVQQREAGVRHDLIDAVFALGGEDDLVRLLARVKALQAFMETSDGTDLLAGYKRAANLLKQAGEISPSSSAEGLSEHDLALLAALDAAEPAAAAAVADERFTDAMTALAGLRAPIDAFFTGVMVNDPDPQLRDFRLGLLLRFRDAVHAVADFSKIEG